VPQQPADEDEDDGEADCGIEETEGDDIDRHDGAGNDEVANGLRSEMTAHVAIGVEPAGQGNVEVGSEESEDGIDADCRAVCRKNVPHQGRQGEGKQGRQGDQGQEKRPGASSSRCHDEGRAVKYAVGHIDNSSRAATNVGQGENAPVCRYFNVWNKSYKGRAGLT
jgi:hypothetical protein